MSVNTATRTDQKHGLMTRSAHMGLALAIILQLATSLIMEHPRKGRPGDFFFEVHEYVGLLALGFAFLFWFVVFSASNRSAVDQALSVVLKVSSVGFLD